MINLKKGIQKQTLLFSLVSILVFIGMFILNRMYPVLLDDWVYAFVYDSNPAKKIGSLMDLIESQYTHYLQWGGRSVVHFIAQFLLSLEPIWHDLLNTFAFLAFVFVLYKAANIGNKTNVVLFTVVVMLVWLCETTFAGTLLWITGSANYLWGTLIIVSFLYPYLYYYQTEKSSSGVLKSALFLIFGVIAGWTNENMSVALIFFIAGLLIAMRYQKIKIPVWAILGFVGVVAGCIIMIKAPGNYIRYTLEMESENKVLTDAYSIETLLSRFSGLWRVYRKYILLLTCVNIGLLALFIYTNKSEKRKRVITLASLLLLTVHVAWIAMLAAPRFEPRAAFGIIAFLIISICFVCINLDFGGKKYAKKIRIVGLVLYIGLIAGTIIDAYKKCVVLNQIYQITHYRDSYIDEHKKKGQMDFVFKGNLEVRDKFYFKDFSDDPKFWFNVGYSRYKGINSIRVIPADSVPK